jgi:broad specificity phosphatase PhoE
MKILFIRHSETILDKVKSNLVWMLSEDGIKAAKELTNHPEILNCEKIYTSFQTKALETALILAKHNFIPIIPIKELTETTSVTNKYINNFTEEIEKWHGGGYRINDGETKEESSARFNKVIDMIVKENQDTHQIGIVTHGDVLACFLANILGINSYELHKRLKMPDLIKFDRETNKVDFLISD